MALIVPPFLYSWDEGRADIAASLDLLRTSMMRIPGDHPAVPELRNAALLIDGWLSRHPATPPQRAYEAGPRDWNEEIAVELMATWKRIEPLVSDDERHDARPPFFGGRRS